jgi:nucleoside-diphosphate-sugar epimerase
LKILITGIHGFVGSNLVKEFSQHHEIYGLDIVSPKKEGVVITFDWTDLERKEIPDVDIIIHLAGKAHDTKNYTKVSTYFEVNSGLTSKVFDYFLNSNAEKFIYFSSVKAVADTVGDYALKEDETPHPLGPYGESKLEAEKYILSNFPPLQPTLNPQLTTHYSQLTIHNSVLTTPNSKLKTENAERRTLNAEHKKVYILRPCMIHGPGNKGNLNLLYKVVKKRIPWPLGEFNNRRSFTSIANLNFVISQLINKDILSGIYNMADDQPLSTNELITIMSQAMHQKPHIWHLPKSLMTNLASLGSVLHLPLNEERLQKLTENYVVSNEKIKEVLEVEKLPVSSHTGILITLQSFNT